jgi:hypothetical protein
MQRLIDGQQVRQIAPPAIDQAVDPGGSHRPVRRRFDRERRVIERFRMTDGSITPDRRARQRRGQDLLRIDGRRFVIVRVAPLPSGITGGITNGVLNSDDI